MPSTTSKTKPKRSYTFDAIGTAWAIETPKPLPETLRNEIGECIENFDKAYSRFRDDSVVMQMAERPGTYELPDSSESLAKLYRQLYDATDGAMTPLIGDSLVAAGYDKNYSLQPSHARQAPAWQDVLDWHGRSIAADRPVVLDIGAAGKGCLIDLVAEILEKAGFTQYIIDASGDIRHRGKVAETVGLENPHDASRVIGTVELRDASLCASAVNRRSWADGRHHVLDGRTGEPTREVVATWVIAKSTLIADGLATALFFVDASQLKPIARFDYARLHADGKLEHSEGFVGELFV